ncbi:MAG: EamA family transporter [Patescibacteria group bacterium]
MSWILIASISYLLLAIVNLTDKFMVDNIIKSSKLYVFLVCSLGALIVFLSPWLLVWPGWTIVSLNFIAGILFVVAQYFLYESLRSGSASKSLILIGGSIPVFTFLFSVAFLEEHFSAIQVIGGAYLLFGIFLMAFLPTKKHFWEKILLKFRTDNDVRNNLKYIFLASFFYSLFFTLTKFVYSLQSFWSAFIWVRLCALIIVILLLFIPVWRADIFSLFHKKRKLSGHHNWKITLLFLFNQGLGSISFVLQNYAIFLGSVAMVNALQGVQYGALLFFGLVFGGVMPKNMREKFSLKIFSYKVLAIVIISLGLYFII